jgi:hypothetical protein
VSLSDCKKICIFLIYKKILLDNLSNNKPPSPSSFFIELCFCKDSRRFIIGFEGYNKPFNPGKTEIVQWALNLLCSENELGRIIIIRSLQRFLKNRTITVRTFDKIFFLPKRYKGRITPVPILSISVSKRVEIEDACSACFV